MVVKGKFCMGDFISPGTRVASTEDLKVCFNPLVDTFHFTVRLGVIHRWWRERVVIIQKFLKLFSNGGGKLWALI